VSSLKTNLNHQHVRLDVYPSLFLPSLRPRA
jgi:hypothetical protein